MSSYHRINGHGHLLPYPEDIPAFMRKKKLFWVDEDRKFMRQGDWKRPVTDPSFFLEEKLEWMTENNIQHEVILNLSQLYANGLERSLAKETIQFQNDFNASVQRKYPYKFTCGFVVQPAHMEDALAEIERCVVHHNMTLLCLPTHFTSETGDWISVASPEAAPIWELANEYSLSIQIHPYDAQKMVGLKDQFWRFHLIWMCAQTADTYHCYSLLDFPDKYPDTKVCFAHGNQFGQMNIGRRQQGFDGRPDLFENTTSPRKNIHHPNVFFDTLVHDVLSFEILIRRQSIRQIVAGLDDPYPLGEMSNVPNSYPGKVIDEAVNTGIITEKDRELIWTDNVLRWIGKEWIGVGM